MAEGTPSHLIAEPTNARSRRTRAALLSATRQILASESYDALTMDAVAHRAGVSRRAVYLHFGSRAALIDGLFDHIARTEGLHESLEKVWEAPDAVAALQEWARHLARYHPKLVAVTRAIDRLRHTDDAIARHRLKVVRAQLANCRRLAEWLADEDRLALPWTVETATDMLWSLISTDMVDGLLTDRRWSQRRLADHLAHLFRSTFVGTPG